MTGDLPIQKQSKMTEQEEKQTSIEYLLDLLGNREDFDSIKFNQICLNARAKYENELKLASDEEFAGFSMGVSGDPSIDRLLPIVTELTSIEKYYEYYNN